MASYGLYVTDNLDGTFSLTTLLRAPTVHTITGGTDLTVFAEAIPATQTESGSVVNGQRFQPQDVFLQALFIVAADRSKNG